MNPGKLLAGDIHSSVMPDPDLELPPSRGAKPIRSRKAPPVDSGSDGDDPSPARTSSRRWLTHAGPSNSANTTPTQRNVSFSNAKLLGVNDDEAETKARRRKSGLSARRDAAQNEIDADAQQEDEVPEDPEDAYDDLQPPTKKSIKKPKSHHLTGKGKPTLSLTLTSTSLPTQRLPSHQAHRPLNVLSKPPTTAPGVGIPPAFVQGKPIQPSGSGPSAIGAVLAGLSAGGGAGGGGMTIEAMSENFEEWMKLATDNKITATNTWNFALIDYFADLTLLRNGPDDQSINFQKASATLDGCVKVWTSRVDSVATETGKLLSGLASGGDADEQEEGQEGEEGEEGEKTQKRKAHRSEATLAKSFAPLQVKKFDLEFTVDPLFKKTCADFDEGGAMGLLMNHLGVDGKGRVVFDAGDVEVDDAAEEEEGAREDEEEDYVEIDRLKELMPDLDDLNDRNISVTLADFKFTADPNEAFSLAFLGNNDKDDNLMNVNQDDDEVHSATGQGVQDFFGGDDDLGGDFGGGGDDFFSPNPEDDGDDADVFRNNVEPQHGGPAGGPMDLFDPTRRNANGGLVMAMLGEGENADMMMDYFDQGLLKNWAGPEHWKLRRVTRKTDPAQATAAKAAKKEKTPFLVDFTSPSTVDVKKLFASGAKASIQQPAAKGKRVSTGRRKGGRKSKAVEEEERPDEHLLPDDMHFSSRQLLRLFLKPKFTLKMRRQGAVAAQMDNENGEVDENFWAQAAADQADGGMGGDDNDDGGESGPMPFETQFFHDDDASAADFAEIDDGLADMGNPEEEDLWAASQGQLKKSKPESVQYAKRAKRVDVKRLKDNIWKGLDIKTNVDPETESEAEPTTPKDGEPLTHEERTFDSVIQNLRGSYPQEKMSEISTSFCFICLLHLANEQGLELEANRFDDGDGLYHPESAGIDVTKDRVVGELQAIKITRDAPTA